ncbi:MAG TPA: T9SS type A sorting domain-containing protein [Flavobacteriaceae bacterium]|nr:T9SS type A sorting domain-containing protein [Flavobacteriaceae bacterium]
MKYKLLLLLLFLFPIQNIVAQPPCGISALESCDDNNDGLALFDLTVLDNTYPFCFVNANPALYYPPTHHLSQADADTGNNPIANPETFLGSNEQFIYMRAESLNSESEPLLSFLCYELVVENCLNTQDFDLNRLRVYPNPVVDILKIDAEDEFNDLEIEVYNLQGKRVFNQLFYENRIDLSELTSGVYFLKVKSDFGKKVFKLVKK